MQTFVDRYAAEIEAAAQAMLDRGADSDKVAAGLLICGSDLAAKSKQEDMFAMAMRADSRKLSRTA